MESTQIADSLPELARWIANKQYSSVHILVDKNTHQHCLDILIQHVPQLTASNVIVLQSGEKHKQLNTCIAVWNKLVGNADRHSLLINLGGGVIADLGGFVASTFKRGIAFVNIPTTLLAMVDAAHGGKTGIDFEGLKNEIGTFALAQKVIIEPAFLQTLPQRQLVSGFAEMLKHGLIADAAYFEELALITPQQVTIQHIKRSIAIKQHIVQQDPTEKGLRKILNFGHTIGHAIESDAIRTVGETALLHGEAIAAGMLIEAHLSYQNAGISEQELIHIAAVITRIYSYVAINEDAVIALLKHDKKNKSGEVHIVALQAIGKATTTAIYTPEAIHAAFLYYKQAYGC